MRPITQEEAERYLKERDEEIDAALKIAEPAHNLGRGILGLSTEKLLPETRSALTNLRVAAAKALSAVSKEKYTRTGPPRVVKDDKENP